MSQANNYRNKLYAYVAHRVRGLTPNEAAAKVNPDMAKEKVYDAAARMENDSQTQALLELFFEADGSTPEDIRREVTAGYLDDSRNPNLPISARHHARDSLIKIYGLDQRKVLLSPDDEFRKFLLGDE
ncbi:MAG: hypothetical protein LUE08_07080 [Akkermansiaceae bacterium]|nr:hypothetical protein [Akkermansiaceae bacterium]